MEHPPPPGGGGDRGGYDRVAVEITADTDRTDDVVFVHDKKYVSTKTLE